VVIGLGALLTIARLISRKAEGKTKGGMPMHKRITIVLSAACLETIWQAAAGAIQTPKG
jgi:hypothetical protein